MPLSNALPVPLSDALPVPLSDELMATIAVDWFVPRLDRRYGGNTALSPLPPTRGPFNSAPCSNHSVSLSRAAGNNAR